MDTPKYEIKGKTLDQMKGGLAKLEGSNFLCKKRVRCIETLNF